MAPHQDEQSEIVAEARPRHATVGMKDPPGHRAVVGPQCPPIAELEIEEVELGPVGPAHASFRADVAQVAIDRHVAGQDEMVAVVDRHVEQAVVIGAAPAAGVPCRLGEDDALAAARHGDRRRQAGQPAADDVNGHPNTLQRTTR
jgi:hypothetical protein